jgi:hypothetical protein
MSVSLAYVAGSISISPRDTPRTTWCFALAEDRRRCVTPAVRGCYASHPREASTVQPASSTPAQANSSATAPSTPCPRRGPASCRSAGARPSVRFRVPPGAGRASVVRSRQPASSGRRHARRYGGCFRRAAGLGRPKRRGTRSAPRDEHVFGAVVRERLALEAPVQRLELQAGDVDQAQPLVLRCPPQ